MRRNTITQLILEGLCRAGAVSFGAFLPKNHPRARLARMILGLDFHQKVSPATASSILSRLKRQGLVERDGTTRNSVWRITQRGRKWHQALYQEKAEPEKDGITRLVIFDIPEFERRKRTAVRAHLIGCNFRQLQKSVWIGESSLPADFIALLDELSLRGKVHIFSVREKGTMTEV
ncbi:MAG: hypothetical protein HY006_02690 [Candidatus Sungbacteria bacterium]|nr:hypothetical protein [Candidatus Sungbacteria bacterium]